MTASLAVRLSIIRVNGVNSSSVPSANIRVCRKVSHRMVAFVSKVKKDRAVWWNTLIASMSFFYFVYNGEADVNHAKMRLAKVHKRLTKSMYSFGTSAFVDFIAM